MPLPVTLSGPIQAASAVNIRFAEWNDGSGVGTTRLIFPNFEGVDRLVDRCLACNGDGLTVTAWKQDVTLWNMIDMLSSDAAVVFAKIAYVLAAVLTGFLFPLADVLAGAFSHKVILIIQEKKEATREVSARELSEYRSESDWG
jgi:hypothetical protein